MGLFRKKRKLNRDFCVKSSQNPYFKYQKERRENILAIFYMTLLFTAIGMIIYFICFSPYFRIDPENISYHDLREDETGDNTYIIIDSYIADQLGKRKMLIFPQKNILFFERGEVEKKIMRELALDQLKISKKLPDRLEISYRTRDPYVILANYNGYALADKNGIVFKFKSVEAPKIDVPKEIIPDEYLSPDKSEPAEGEEAKNFEKIEDKTPLSEKQQREATREEYFIFLYDMLKDRGLPIIYCGSDDIIMGKENLSKRIIDYAAEIFDSINKRKEFAVNYFYLNNFEAGEIEVYTDEGWKILFNMDNSAESQIKKLYITLNEKIKDVREELQYIDLRYPERIYYK